MNEGEGRGPSKVFDIIALGDGNVDVLLTGVDSIPQKGKEVLAKERHTLAGGSTTTFACWSSRMGMKVTFIGKLGEDYWGKKVKETLKKAGVDTKQIIFASREKTGLTVCLSGKDRSLISHLGTNATLCKEEIDFSSFSQGRHLHVSGFFLLKGLQPAMQEIFKVVKDRYQMSISLDPGWDPQGRWRYLENLLNHIDILILNEEELKALTKKVTLKESLQTLTRSCPWIIVKRGNRGALAWNGKKTIEDKGFKVKMVDTTSSGDTFNAGLIYGWLKGLPVKDCLVLGNACGALCVGRIGANVKIPDMKEIKQFLKRGRGNKYMNYETATMKEIMEQPDCWEKTVKLADRKAKDIKSAFSGIEEVIFTGCGSAYNVSWVAAPTFQHFTGIKARAFPAAEIFQYPDTVFTKGTRYMVIPISRSGKTTETVKAMQYALEREIKTLSITCFPQSPLATCCEKTLVLEWTQEKSVVTTQSLTSMVLMTQLLSGIVLDKVGYLNQLRQLPIYGKKVLANYQTLGKEIGEKEEIEKFAFVGSGPYYGLAREAQLKIKEMTLLPSDSYPVLEYRHGPKSNVDSHMLVTIFASDVGGEYEVTLAKEIKSLGGKSLLICDEIDPVLKELVDYSCILESGLSEFARGILYMPVIHLVAYHKALKRGLNPDSPKNVSYWVKT